MFDIWIFWKIEKIQGAHRLSSLESVFFWKQYLALVLPSKLLAWVPKILISYVGRGNVLRSILTVHYKNKITFDSFCFACFVAIKCFEKSTTSVRFWKYLCFCFAGFFLEIYQISTCSWQLFFDSCVTLASLTIFVKTWIFFPISFPTFFFSTNWAHFAKPLVMFCILFYVSPSIFTFSELSDISEKVGCRSSACIVNHKVDRMIRHVN